MIGLSEHAVLSPEKTEGEADVMWSTRRGFFKGSAAAVGDASGLPPGLGLAEQVLDKFDGGGFRLAAPEPNPRSGRVRRMGTHRPAEYFGVYTSSRLHPIWLDKA